MCLLAAPSALAAAPPAAGDYIVETVPGAVPGAVAGSVGLTSGQLSHTYSTVLSGFSATLTAAQAAALTGNPQVASVTPDGETRALTTQSLSQVTPNGMYTSPWWALDRIDQRPTVGDGRYSYDTTGQGVTVFVLDSGIRSSHSEFGGRVAGGYNFVANTADTSTCTTHATAVASVIGGATAGVAKAVTLVPLQVLGCNVNGNAVGQWSDMIAALDWVVAHKPAGPAVVNISAGGAAYDLVDKAVNRTIAAGFPVVVAAGLQGDACDTSPSRVPNALTVGGTDYRDWLYIGSSDGPCIDLFAPADVVAAASDRIDSEVTWNDGTSLSAAFVSGIAARTLQSTPTATPAQLGAAILAAATPTEVLGSANANTRIAYIAPPVTTLPGAPTGFSLTQNNAARTATINWTPTSSAAGAAVTGYRVARDGTDSKGVGAWSAVVPATSHAQSFINLKPGVSYTLSVQAITSAGTGAAASGRVTIAALPGKPVIGTATGGVKSDSVVSVKVSWLPPTSGGTVTSYAVTTINQSTGARKTVSAIGSARSAQITGLRLGASYSVAVVAVNATGGGPTSASSNVVVAQ